MMNRQGRGARPVLVVDPDPDGRRVAQEALQGHDLEVTVVSDGRQALAQASRRHPAAVVCDPALLDADARTVVDELRRLCGPGLPILVVSAAEKVAERAREIGAFSFLEKPVDADHLLVAVLRGLSVASRP